MVTVYVLTLVPAELATLVILTDFVTRIVELSVVNRATPTLVILGGEYGRIVRFTVLVALRPRVSVAVTVIVWVPVPISTLDRSRIAAKRGPLELKAPLEEAKEQSVIVEPCTPLASAVIVTLDLPCTRIWLLPVSVVTALTVSA